MSKLSKALIFLTLCIGVFTVGVNYAAAQDVPTEQCTSLEQQMIDQYAAYNAGIEAASKQIIKLFFEACKQTDAAGENWVPGAGIEFKVEGRTFTVDCTLAEQQQS